MNTKLVGLFLVAITITTHVFPALSKFAREGEESCAVEENDWTLAPIHKAARDGNIEKIRELIGKSHDVNDVDYDKGWTPLHWAAANNHAKCAEELLHHGAEINKADDEDWTPLHVAAFHGNVSCFSTLLEHCPDTTLQIRTGVYAGLTAEALARENGHKEILDFFVLEIPAGHYLEVPEEHDSGIATTPAPANNLTKITTWLTEWWR